MLDHARQHVSLHPHYDSALEAAAELLDGADENSGPERYSILERTVGEGMIGAADHTTLDEPVREQADVPVIWRPPGGWFERYTLEPRPEVS